MAYRNATGSSKKKRKKSKKKSSSTKKKKKSSRKKKSSSSRKKKSSTTKKKATKQKRRYTRYDPATGEKARVTTDDERYDEWLTRTQWESKKKAAIKERERYVLAGAKLAEASAPVLATGATTAYRKIKSAGAAASASAARLAATRVAVGAGTAATVSIGSAAALAIAAGAVSYFGTRWLIDTYGRLTDKNERAFAAALAFKKARDRAQRELGRPLSADEVRFMGQEFKNKLASIGWRT